MMETGNRSSWGGTEIVAVVLLVVAWVALALAFIVPVLPLPAAALLWFALGALGLVFVWLSAMWTQRQKLIVIGVEAVLYVIVVLIGVLLTPVTVVQTQQ